MTAALAVLTLFAPLATGCEADVPAEPGLADSLLVEALVSVHLADARAERTGADRDSLRALALTLHGTDTTAFHRALDYYAHHPEAYEPLYDRALDRLLDERRDVLR